MKKYRKNYEMRRKTASAMAVMLAVLSPGVLPAGYAMAESAGAFVPESRAGYERASGSDSLWQQSGGKGTGKGIARQAEAGENGLKTERSGQDEWETRAIGTDDLEDGESGVDEIELEMDLATDSDAASEADLGMNRKKQAMADLATDSNAQPLPQIATQSNLALFAMQLSTTGDLWTDWNGNTNFPGEGTKESPYQIETLSHLMGLSESVAAGNDYEDCYFELTQSLDLGGLSINNGNWNPIGWYCNRAELGGEVQTPFRGHFNGCGNTMTGFQILGESGGMSNLGLFGVIDGGSVENLEIEGEQVTGENWTGILAGTIKNGQFLLVTQFDNTFRYLTHRFFI